MVEIKFELKPVDSKPIRKSVYDPIIDAFLKGEEEMMEVRVKGRNPTSLRQVLNLRINKRSLKSKIRVFTRGGKVYLRRLNP